MKRKVNHKVLLAMVVDLPGKRKTTHRIVLSPDPDQQSILNSAEISPPRRQPSICTYRYVFPVVSTVTQLGTWESVTTADFN